MATLQRVNENSSNDIFAQNSYLNNMSQFIKVMTEIPEAERQAEEELNKLRTSNVLKLGLLKKQQEADLLDAMIDAEKQLLDQRKANLLKAVEEEAKTRRAELIAAEIEAAKTRRSKSTTSSNDELRQKQEQIDSLITYEFNGRKKQLKKEQRAATQGVTERLQEEARGRAKLNANGRTATRGLKKPPEKSGAQSRSDTPSSQNARTAPRQTSSTPQKKSSALAEFFKGFRNRISTPTDSTSTASQPETGEQRETVTTRLQSSATVATAEASVDSRLQNGASVSAATKPAVKSDLTSTDDIKLSEAELANIEAIIAQEQQAKIAQIDELIEYEKKAKEKAIKDEQKELEARRKKQQRDENAKAASTLLGKPAEGATVKEDWESRKEAFKEIFADGKKINKDGTTENAGKLSGIAYLASNLTSALSTFAKQLETQMDEIASKKSAIDTRLQGSSNTAYKGSYWDQMSKDITGFAGVSPLVKQSAIADRVAAMVSQGISFNVEQRATLDVLKDKIATTFDAANGTLLRLVKIQQQDTTAGRLGMESALNAFLNNMYETTEYMQGLARSVKGSLEEAMSLMTGENALSFEYQIQKWLGSLSSVGMSDTAVQGLAGVLGQVAAGKLEGITGGGQGNLVIMAANQAGVNMSDILNDGLDQNTTNVLMDSMVDYLAKLYNDAGSSKVIQQQIASVYGLSASDLKAAVNLSRSRQAVAKDGLDYNSAMGRLYSMAGTMGSRTSLGEQLSNMWANTQYSMAAGIANNPAMYGLYKMSGLLKDTTGGINFGLPLVMGNGMPITFNVADLMRTGALAGGVMSSLGTMLSSGGGGGLTGSSILKGIGLTGTGITTVTRGNGSSLSTMGGMTVSESGSMVGNANSDDMTSKTMTDQTDSAKNDTASAVDESDDTKLSDVDNHVVTIIEILRDISAGNSILKVAIDGDVRIATESLTSMGL